MGRFIEGYDRSQPLLLPACVDDYVPQESLVRVVDGFVETLDLTALGFERTVSAATGRPGYHPGDMLRLYIWGYLNQLRLAPVERACQRDLEAIWLMRRMTPDYRTIAAFRHDNPEAIIRTGAAFISFCRENGLVTPGKVALDGTKMAVASAKNIAGADRLARDIAHTETEIAYYLDRLNIADQHPADVRDQTVNRAALPAPSHRWSAESGGWRNGRPNLQSTIQTSWSSGTGFTTNGIWPGAEVSSL
jgi:transposase